LELKLIESIQKLHDNVLVMKFNDFIIHTTSTLPTRTTRQWPII